MSATAGPVDLLVRGDFVYPMTPGLPIVTQGEVAVRAGRIVYAGAERPAGTWQPQRTLGGPGKAVLPGFVNCHCHTASLVFRSQTDDFSGGAGLYGIAFRMEKDIGDEEWAALATLGCADMLHAGVTTLNDIWYHPEGLARAVEAAGLRAMIANKVFDVHLEALHTDDYTRYPEIGERRLRDGVAFAERWHGGAGGRILARLGTHASDTCDATLHREARREADRLGIGMHIHTAQSPREVAHIRTAHGTGPLVYLRDIGLLRDDVVVAHLTFADEADLAAVAETGARYAHCPTIYPRRGRYPPLQTIREQGIVTGFATDWMLNDPFEGMRYAMNTSRVLLGDPNHLPSAEALWHSTQGAADVLGLGDEIGSLEAGKRADLIVLDVERPHLQPFYGAYPALVYYARAGDIVASVVDGRVVMEDGRLLGIDEAQALAAVRTRLPRWAERLRELGSRALPDTYGC